MYKILTLNGGGIRSYITLKVLEYIEERSGRRISDMFDMVVGTSAGALVGAMLDTMSAKEIIDSFYGVKDELFAPNWFGVGGFLQSKYNTNRKERAIKQLLTNDTILNFDFAAVSYDLNSSRPVIFNTIDDENNNKYLLTTKYTISDAVIGSTAAPVFWNPYELDNMLLSDGALVANDPTSVAVKLALTEDIKLHDLFIVNLTTGNNTRSYPYLRKACALKWIVPLLNILMSSQPNATYMLYSEEGIRYTSLDVELTNASDNIDDTSDENIHALEIDAQELIKNRREEIDQIIKDII